MAVAQGFGVEREPTGKCVTARIALPDDPGGDVTERGPQQRRSAKPAIAEVPARRRQITPPARAGRIGETVAFGCAVTAVRNYAAGHPDTLAVATADHGHTSRIVPLPVTPPGLPATLITDEGGR